MKTLILALAVGVAAFLGLHLLAPSPSWEDTGDSLAEFLNGAVRAVIGKGDARGGPIVPAIPTLPAYSGPFRAGQQVEVAGPRGCLNERIYPRLDAPARSCLPEGTRLKIILGPTYAQGIWWWAAEREGWIGEPYLSPVVTGEEEPLIAQEVAAGGNRSQDAVGLPEQVVDMGKGRLLQVSMAMHSRNRACSAKSFLDGPGWSRTSAAGDDRVSPGRPCGLRPVRVFGSGATVVGPVSPSGGRLVTPGSP